MGYFRSKKKPTMEISIKRAFFSLYDKKKGEPLLKILHKFGVEIFASEGTKKYFLSLGIPVKSIEEYTGFPQILKGRVKTLHPKIYGGILFRRGDKEDEETIKKYSILNFDLVCVDLYPFEKEPSIENIDIGGVSLLRAAAKNYRYVVPIYSSEVFPEVIRELNQNQGKIPASFSKKLAKECFYYTSYYDSLIARFLEEEKEEFSPFYTVGMRNPMLLRYGENPHQKGVFYATFENNFWEKLQGKELSYNNLLDIHSACCLLEEFTYPTCCIIKHNLPCAVVENREGLKQHALLERALQSDPISFFGGIVAFNEELKEETAEILSRHFFEVVIAPSYSEEARKILEKKPSLRVIQIKEKKKPSWEIRSALGGYLLQERDQELFPSSEISIPTKKKPSEKDLEELFFAFKVVKHVRSNAVVFSKNFQTIGIGSGQASRVDAVYAAMEKARRSGFSLKDSYLASEAFFPFPDSITLAAGAGVRAIIQPGGSIRDQEVIQEADKYSIAMVFTHRRHFKH